MKSLVIIVCIVVYTSALSQDLINDLVQKIQEYGVECAESEEATEADISALMQKQIPVSHEGKCVAFCTFKKLNIMHPDGQFGEGYVEWLEKAKVDDPIFYNKLEGIYEVCQKKVEINSDPCETAVALAVCWKEEREKVDMVDIF